MSTSCVEARVGGRRLSPALVPVSRSVGPPGPRGLVAAIWGEGLSHTRGTTGGSTASPRASLHPLRAVLQPLKCHPHQVLPINKLTEGPWESRCFDTSLVSCSSPTAPAGTGGQKAKPGGPVLQRRSSGRWGGGSSSMSLSPASLGRREGQSSVGEGCCV